MASIDKRPDGKWRARWREYAGGPQKTRHFTRKVDAERFLDGIRGDLARGAYIDPSAGKQTFRSYSDEWAEAREGKGTRRDSWTHVRARLLPHLGDLPLASIDRLTLERTRAELGKRYARTTTGTTMVYAGMVLRHAYASGRIGHDRDAGAEGSRGRSRRQGRS